MTNQQLIERRRKALGPAYSHFYDKPLHLVKGQGVWMWDDQGKRYLDCYNNVASVGHCHPHVVEALCGQARTLNTHTRYLHENVVGFAETLASKMPGELSVCMPVCTGTEANDLAVQIARVATGRHGCIVAEHSYHGNSTLVHDLSTSERFGDPDPDWLATVEPPDTYRGPFREGENDLGAKYAGLVSKSIQKLEARGHQLAVFMVESAWENQGIMQAPQDYLNHAAAFVRDAGGLVVADEVQSGYCRMGAHWWGFKHYDIIPDIVTLGKPMGNGHPLGAVVTTPAIVEKFAERYEYFNTFGGNPVSAAVGQAVIEVIDNENLLANATEVGAYLEGQLQELADRYDMIGELRGRGLFWGLDLVSDPDTREPISKEELRRITTDAAKQGTLVATMGRYGNVMKIRPPLVFSRDNVDHLINALDTVFARAN
ncbi:MAG: aminotransferase class III-fold pyridoxal phosphate-dependent enzyme [Gammaproteobacteria bacterium]|nr:aminotransferase class III-fold pyridoxal phosphate-dependent enzyme [Gammaproteobacteria bacterium]MDH3466706.1 aminotransferase class III-fold pyridoxal phosphate-dependent enzyme [Gammaproteobacteria bacterium]